MPLTGFTAIPSRRIRATHSRWRRSLLRCPATPAFTTRVARRGEPSEQADLEEAVVRHPTAVRRTLALPLHTRIPPGRSMLLTKKFPCNQKTICCEAQMEHGHLPPSPLGLLRCNLRIGRMYHRAELSGRNRKARAAFFLTHSAMSEAADYREPKMFVPGKEMFR
jgi:hypothetical protein